MRRNFTVTYEVVTGGKERGFVHPGGVKFDADDPGPHKVTLREALETVEGPFEDSGQAFPARLLAVDDISGEQARYVIHPPEAITRSSYRRLARVVCSE